MHFCPLKIVVVKDNYLEFVGQGVPLGFGRFIFLGRQADPIPASGEGVCTACFKMNLESARFKAFSERTHVPHQGLPPGDDHGSVVGAWHLNEVLEFRQGMNARIPGFFDVAPVASYVAATNPHKKRRAPRVCSFALNGAKSLHEGQGLGFRDHVQLEAYS